MALAAGLFLASFFSSSARAYHSATQHEWYGSFHVDVNDTDEFGRTLKGSATITIPAEGLISTSGNFHYNSPPRGSCMSGGQDGVIGDYTLTDATHGAREEEFGNEIRLSVSTHAGGYSISDYGTYYNGNETLVPLGPCSSGGGDRDPAYVSLTGFNGISVPEGTVIPNAPGPSGDLASAEPTELCGQTSPAADSGCQKVEPNNVMVSVAGRDFRGTATWNLSSQVRESPLSDHLVNRDACPSENSPTPDGCQGLVVASIGDSVASGEGNGPGWQGNDRWESTQCHRSPLAGTLVGERALGISDGKKTFFACSGAKINVGLLKPYYGIGAFLPKPLYELVRGLVNALRKVRFLDARFADYLPEVPRYPDYVKPSQRQPAQLDRLQQIGPKMDALLISIGANDLGFSSILQGCIVQGAKQLFTELPSSVQRTLKQQLSPSLAEESGSPRWKDSCDHTEAAAVFARNLEHMLDYYEQLDTALTALQIPPDRVYLTEYFDPTHDADGDYCATTDLNPAHPDGLFRHSLVTIHHKADVIWAQKVVLTTLNTLVRGATLEYGWNLIGGIADDFLNHGYCAGPHSWIVKVRESLQHQKDIYGAFHPNALGQACYGTHMWQTLDQTFFGPYVAPWTRTREPLSPSLLPECFTPDPTTPP